ncbi:MAG TPA: DUF6390 family protein [Candidatus Limnocylindria bacterium]|nr:DUF6390 family protein [Candidatus Limnocylindria bacterium]
MSAPPSGARLFARYAYGPNRLGLCGPDDSASLLGESQAGGDERLVRDLARGFEGAYPYLELIARANAIADPLDRRVVEAYWLGSSLLEGVSPQQFGESMGRRFRPRLGRSDWKWLEASVPSGAKPVHAFHVLDVFPKVGLMRSEQVDDVLAVMDSCRIRWGRVVERIGDKLLVRAVPLTLVEGRLALGSPRLEEVTGWRDGQGFVGEVAAGDVVSIHWDWACEVLGRPQLARLVAWTRHELSIANQSI